MGVFLSFLVTLVIAAVVILIVGKLGLGMEVAGFGAAIVAALVIAIVTAIVVWLLSYVSFIPEEGWVGAIVSLIVAAIILMISDRFVSGMTVNGFGGAIVAAIAIGVVTWVVNWIISFI